MRILITGANGAMAKETIKHLIEEGCDDIVMAVRTKSKGEIARAEILKDTNAETENLSVVEGFDMNKPNEIIDAVGKLKGEAPFDVVFLAAGFAVFGDDYQHVEHNGKKVEKTVFQNLVGSHVVFNELKKTSLLKKGARIVLAGGEGARGIKGMIEKPDFPTVKSLRDYVYLNPKSLPKYNPMNAIGVSKFVGALWTKKVASLEKDNLEIVWFSPGMTAGSEGLKKLPFLKRYVFKMMFGMMQWFGKAQTAAQGGKKFADCLLGKVGKHGELIGAPEGKMLGEYTEQSPLNPILDSEELRETFWDMLQEIVPPR